MVDHLTALAIVVPSIFVILYDLVTFLRRCGDVTVSWTMCFWGLTNPILVLLLAVLGGHLFWPECALPGQPHVTTTVMQGTVAAILAVLGLGVIVWRTWKGPTELVMSHLRMVLAPVMLIGGLVVGHFYVPQYVACGG